MRIAVLGGGISGLTAARRLQRFGEVTVFEARDHPGGNIRTEDFEGCRVERGPNGFLDNSPATLELVAELGLEERLVRARSEAARRFIFRQGRLRELPAKPPLFLLSSALPVLGRLRVLLEPWAKKPPKNEETVYEFACRRIGKSAAEILVDAMVTGIFAGDPHRLSVGAAFPKLKALEAQYGSLLKAARSHGLGPPGTLTSLDQGMEVLIEALAEGLDLQTSTVLDSIPSGFDHVFCALPSSQAANLVDGPLASLLHKIPTASVVVVALVFDEPVEVPDGFGFLVPRNQGLRILGTLYESSIFPGRAPDGRRLVRVLIGGRRDPGAINLEDQVLLDIVASDLQQAWGTFPTPRSHTIFRHRLGIAQYELGHQDLVQKIHTACPPELHLIGSSYHGVALNACIEEARSLCLPR